MGGSTNEITAGTANTILSSAGSKASGTYNTVMGFQLLGSGNVQLVLGMYNVEDSTKALIIGYGTSTSTLLGSGRFRTTVTNADGGTEIQETYRDGQVASQTGTAIAPRRYVYGVEADGEYTQEILLNADGSDSGQWVKNYLDFVGRPWKTLTSSGAITQHSFNPLGQRVKTVDPDGVAMLTGYDSRGRQTTLTVDVNRDGNVNLNGTDRIRKSVTTITTRGSVVVRRSTTQLWATPGVDSPQTMSVQEHAISGLASWSTSNGLTTFLVRTVPTAGGNWTETVTQPDGSTTVSTYANARIVSEVYKDASTTQIRGTTFAYDPHGRLASLTDARNGDTTYTYYQDDSTAATTTPDPDGGGAGVPQVTSTTYTVTGLPDVVTLPDHTPGSPQQTDTDYYTTGHVKQIRGGRNYATDYTYDAQGRMTSLTTQPGTANAAVTTWSYHATTGLIQQKQYATGPAHTFTYTVAGRPLTSVNGRGITATTLYGSATAGVVTGAADMTGVSFSDSTPGISYTYTRWGTVVSAQREGVTRTITSNPFGEWLGESYTNGPLGGAALTPAYDSLRRPSGLTATLGSASVVQTQGYDAASRPSSYTQGSFSVSQSYHSQSSLLSGRIWQQASTTRQTETRSYDLLNRQTQHSTAASSPVHSFTYQYNAANQRTHRTEAHSGTAWHWDYDALGQVTTAQEQDTATSQALPGRSYAYSFDGIGNRLSASLGFQPASAITYTPNALNQYSTVQTPRRVLATGSAQAAATVTVNGNPTTRLGQLWSYEQAVTGSGALAVPLAISATLSPDSQNATRQALLPPASFSPTYDADGNLTADGLRTYTWDAQNRLLSITTDSALPTSIPRYRISYTYDDLGRRVAQRIEGKPNASATTWSLIQQRAFHFAGWNVIAEHDFGGSMAAPLARQLLRSYLWGSDLSGTTQGAGGVGGLLLVTQHRGAQTGSHAVSLDAQGNVTGLVDASTGQVSAQYHYGPFGEPISVTGAAAELCSFRFSTKYTDPVFGLVYYGYRFYAPIAGRWLNRDPIKENGGMNLYGMVGNDAVNGADYLGHEKWSTFQEQLPTFKTPQDMWNHYVADPGKYGNGPYLITCHCGVVDLVHMASGVAATQGGKTPVDYMRERFDKEWGMSPKATDQDRADVLTAFFRNRLFGNAASADDHPSEALGALSGLNKNWQQGVLDVLVKCKPIPDDVYDQFIIDYPHTGTSSALISWPWSLPYPIPDKINKSALKIGKTCCPKMSSNTMKDRLSYFKLTGMDWQASGKTSTGAIVPPGIITQP